MQIRFAISLILVAVVSILAVVGFTIFENCQGDEHLYVPRGNGWIECAESKSHENSSIKFNKFPGKV